MGDPWHYDGISRSKYGLSDEQFDAVIGTRDVFLQACPGSGKTRSVASRVAWLNENDARIALLSFTKIGAEEIGSAVLRDHGIAVGGDNFVGTIQSFLQRYVLTPFAHLLTNAVTGVRIDPEQVEALDPAGLNSSDYSFRLDGSIAVTKKGAPNSQLVLNAVREAKLRAAQQGFVCLNDDVYWSYMVLSMRPEIALALATRFDEIIVDEAQDSNDAQIECLRLIRRAGLSSLVLVGDYDQTIYEWRGSNPELCESFAKESGLSVKKLTENYRSSQLICNLTALFRAGGGVDTAVGEYANLTIPPLLMTYTVGQEAALPEQLTSLVAWAGVTATSKAILTRSGATVQKIAGITAPTATGDIKLLLATKIAGGTLSLDQYKEIERLLVRRAFGAQRRDGELDWAVLRPHTMQLIDQLPELDGDLRSWAHAASVALEQQAQRLSPASAQTTHRYTFDEAWADIPLAAYVHDHKPDVRVSTIHGVKGESIDAVMLVAGNPSQRQEAAGYVDSQTWAQRLSGDVSVPAEDVRVAFVALTRARQLAVVAVPESTQDSTMKRFTSAGFTHMTFTN